MPALKPLGVNNVFRLKCKQGLCSTAHIVGEHFTALDLYYSGLLQWFIQRAQVLPAESVYLDYMNRHLARPAHQRAIALDEALLAEME